PEHTALTASVRRPRRKSPDAPCIQPITYGPTKPPRLPTELINPIPAAAPSPRRKAVGSDQNGGVALYKPIAPIASAASATSGASVNQLDPSPTAASAAHAATTRRRSPARSEYAAITIIPTAANENGIAVQSPTARSEAP